MHCKLHLLNRFLASTAMQFLWSFGTENLVHLPFILAFFSFPTLFAALPDPSMMSDPCYNYCNGVVGSKILIKRERDLLFLPLLRSPESNSFCRQHPAIQSRVLAASRASPGITEFFRLLLGILSWFAQGLVSNRELIAIQTGAGR